MLDFEKLKSIEKDDDKIDYMFDKVEDMFRINNCQKVDEYILNFLKRKFSFYLHIAFLTTAFRYRYNLENHNLLFHTAYELGLTLGDKKIVKSTLSGLNRKDYKQWLKNQ